MSEPGLVVTDLDGTLLGRGGALQQENARMLRALHDRGIPVAIASGRLAGVCSRMALDMGLSTCHIIGMNGAQMWDAPFGKVLATHTFSATLQAQCTAILEENGCVFNLYTDEGVYTNQPLDEAGKARFAQFFQGGQYRTVVAPDAAEQAKGQRCLKFLVKQAGNPAGYQRAEAAIGALPDVYLTASGKDNFEVMLRGVGKAEAVRTLAMGLGVPMAYVAAFGDYDNDVPMLKACGLSVAMGNALPEAKAAARFVTRPHDEAGVAWALERMLRGEWAALEAAGVHTEL